MIGSWSGSGSGLGLIVVDHYSISYRIPYIAHGCFKFDIWFFFFFFFVGEL